MGVKYYINNAAMRAGIGVRYTQVLEQHAAPIGAEPPAPAKLKTHRGTKQGRAA